MIISNSEFLKGYFTKGTVYTKNTASAIYEAYQMFLRDNDKLQAEITAFKPQLSHAWEKQGKYFKILVYSSPSELKKQLRTTSH
jgi:hypothetical protein